MAYEDGDEQWGKDYTIPVEWNRHRGEVDPAFGLYVHRQIKVFCLADGELRQPAQTLESAFAAGGFDGNKSLPRLAIDKTGSVWMLFRRHPLP